MLTEDQKQFLNSVCYGNWTISRNNNNYVNYYGDIDISEMNLTEIPVQFEQVNGYFICDYNRLTTLIGSPIELTGFYSCISNLITNLIGSPKECRILYCQSNQLNSLEGCPKLIKCDFRCENNPNLYVLYGIGKVCGKVYYDNQNDLNEWIIRQAHSNIFSTYMDIAKWIKDNNKLQCLLNAPQEIQQYFSPRILHLVNNGIYHNESVILDYKNFKKLC